MKRFASVLALALCASTAAADFRFGLIGPAPMAEQRQSSGHMITLAKFQAGSASASAASSDPTPSFITTTQSTQQLIQETAARAAAARAATQQVQQQGCFR